MSWAFAKGHNVCPCRRVSSRVAHLLLNIVQGRGGNQGGIHHDALIHHLTTPAQHQLEDIKDGYGEFCDLALDFQWVAMVE